MPQPNSPDSESAIDLESACLGTRDWPHAPPHRLEAAGVYFVTARTVHREPFFHTPNRLSLVAELLRTTALKYQWRMEAWAILNNHYHFVAHSPPSENSAVSLRVWIRDFHSAVSRSINKEDQMSGRTLWHNYRETHLTWPKSYLARLNYTHQNAVHHGLVKSASQYQWCSASEFEKAVTPAWAKTVASFGFQRIAAEDEDQ